MVHEERVAPLGAEDWDDEIRGLVEASGRLNVFATLAHHPKLLQRWMVFAGHVLGKSHLPVREREIVILRVGWRCASDYEFGQHTLIGRQAGLRDEEIEGLAREEFSAGSTEDTVLVAAVDELIGDKKLGEESWQALRGRFSIEQILDLIFTVGQYAMLAMALNSLGVQRDEGVPGFPE